MSVNSYLTNLANKALLRDDEKEGVQRSIATLKARLGDYFGTQISEQYVFGSYSRDTILPRSIDPQSDVDYMIVFSDSGFKPQTYLERLRSFSKIKYASSDVAQSHPSVVLELNHIQFDLVPGITKWPSSLHIPLKESDYQTWKATDPKAFNDTLVRANQAHGNVIKPLIRVLKYWNAESGYPFESYDLEQRIVGFRYGYLGLSPSRQIGDYFLQIVKALHAELFATQHKRDAVARLKDMAGRAHSLHLTGQSAQAESVLSVLMHCTGRSAGW